MRTMRRMDPKCAGESVACQAPHEASRMSPMCLVYPFTFTCAPICGPQEDKCHQAASREDHCFINNTNDNSKAPVSIFSSVLCTNIVCMCYDARMAQKKEVKPLQPVPELT